MLTLLCQIWRNPTLYVQSLQALLCALAKKNTKQHSDLATVSFNAQANVSRHHLAAAVTAPLVV